VIDQENSIYVYKLTTDNGGAPCISNNLLSLCICKPRIRQQAVVGDWIIGLGGRSMPELRGRLIYIARVTKEISNGDYYKDAKYKKRPDCIYKWIDGEFSWKKGSSYHSQDDLIHDMGSPPDYDRAKCLLSSEFVYFGNNASPSIDEIRTIYDELPRDFKVNHNEYIRSKLREFIDSIICEYGYGKHGEPTHKEKSRKCNTESDGIIKNSSC